MSGQPEDRYLELYAGGSCVDDDDFADAGRELELNTDEEWSGR